MLQASINTQGLVMAKMSPRILKRGPKTGYFRHVDEVPANIAGLSGNATGTVSVCLIAGDSDPVNDARLYVVFDAAECKRIAAFSHDCKTGKPLEHALEKRAYLVNEKPVTVRGWPNAADSEVWHVASAVYSPGAGVPAGSEVMPAYLDALSFMCKHGIDAMGIGSIQLSRVK